MRRFAPSRGQKTKRSGSEDRDWRGQKTDQLAALRAVQRTETQALRFRGQGLERTEDRSARGAS
ncbi:MAG: hypothetical protein LBD06_11005, partial [Candidatus Accumulibacter sp.]|nr:hypothetical protein [Accumulibacter sp.]